MKTKTYLGSVFALKKKSGNSYLYFKTPLHNNGKTTSTGLIDTLAHRKIVINKLKELQRRQFNKSTPESELFINDVFLIFIEYCSNRKGLAPKTIQSYK